MELYFASEDAFVSRVGVAKRLLALRGYPLLDNRELIYSLLDKVEALPPDTSQSENLADSGAQSQTPIISIHHLSAYHHPYLQSDYDLPLFHYAHKINI